MSFEAVIGLEVHAQLLTGSKIFCACSTRFGQRPNAAACPVCLGLPGALPVLNREAVTMAMKLILAVGGDINRRSVFARKNYFYPDLPKGYQISQFDQPIGRGGAVVIEAEGESRAVALNRIHLEEDAGKSLHPENSGDDFSRVDVNRCGVSLVEIVTEPVLRSPHEAFQYLHALKQLVEYLGICDGNMEEGSLRCDANVSIRAIGADKLGTKTEVKNMNSIRGVERALQSEIARQIAVVAIGGSIVQQTLLFNESDGKCYPMRSKEESHDYRYFPDPDLRPLIIDEPWLEETRKSLPELPAQRRIRFAVQYAIPDYDASLLTAQRGLADYYEETVEVCRDAKLASNWIMTEVLARLNASAMEIGSFPIAPRRLGDLIIRIRNREITGKIAKELFELMMTDRREVAVIIAEKGLAPVADSGDLERMIEQIIADFPEEAAKYRAGKQKVFGFFVGQLMKATQGKADPALANELLKRKLEQ